MVTIRSVIGDAPKRREDLRFVTGRGHYLDDLAFAGLVHAVVLRSPHAHARIERIDTETARAAPGVLAVLTAEDARADGLQPLRPSAEANVQTGERFAFAPQPLLAEGKVRYVGEPVALIVAETRAQALDAAEQVVVDYCPVAGGDDAPLPRARRERREISAEVPGNLCFDWRTGDAAAVDAAFAAAAHVVELHLDNHRIVTNPMEPRGVIGLWDAERGRYTAYVSSQSIHATRDNTARALGVPSGAVRFVAPDVGGGFGAKNFIYPEHVLILWAAQARRPSGQMDRHPQRGVSRRPSGARPSGRGRAGARRRRPFSGAARRQHRQCRRLSGQRRRRADLPVCPSAGHGLSHPGDRAAGRGGADQHRADRRHPRSGLCRGGQHHRAADRRGGPAMRLRPRRAAAPQHGPGRGDADDQRPGQHRRQRRLRGDLRSRAGCGPMSRALPARRRESEARGFLRGLGFAYHIKGTGGSPHENVDIRFEADGTVSLITGTQTIGQGHETTFPQILADRLGLPNERIRLVQGDTDLIPLGGGHGSSRATYMGGTAIWRASDEIIAKGTRIAAEALEAAEADIRFADGRFVVAGTDRSVALLDVAATRARQGDAARHLSRLDARMDDLPQRRPCRRGRDRPRHRPSHARALHRGRRLRRAGQPDDRRRPGAWRDRPGRRPGAARARGLRSRFRSADRRLVHGLRHCRAPTISRPSISASTRTRCTTNPLGVKGCGEAGAVAAFPAIANAILDALAPLGVTDLAGPATPERIWRRDQRGPCTTWLKGFWQARLFKRASHPMQRAACAPHARRARQTKRHRRARPGIVVRCHPNARFAVPLGVDIVGGHRLVPSWNRPPMYVELAPISITTTGVGKEQPQCGAVHGRSARRSPS